MAFETEIFQDKNLEADYIDWLIDTRWVDIQSHFEKLWKILRTGTGIRSSGENNRICPLGPIWFARRQIAKRRPAERSRYRK